MTLAKNILVTRPEGQQHDMMTTLHTAGWHCLHQPLLTIQPIEEGHPGYHPLRHTMMNLDHYDVVITVSSNASSLAADWIDRFWPQLPIDIKWFAVGHSSATPLQSLDVPVVVPTGHHSEGLLALPELQSMDDKKVLIFRGTGGRELIANTLKQRGAQVEYAEFYERQPAKIDGNALAALLTQQQIHYALVTSGEMAVQLTELLAIAQSKPMHLIVPSARIKNQLKQLHRHDHFADVHVCEHLKGDAMTSALETIYTHTNGAE